MKKPYFTLGHYCVMALMASMGIAVKIIIVPLAQIITGPLFIPGGVVAGGFYMAFLVLADSITGKWGTATIVALIQAFVVTITGTLGTHGAISLLTYTLPGLAIDVLYLVLGRNTHYALKSFLGGVIANIAGSFAVNLAIFNVSLVPLLLAMSTAALSGGLGGLIAHSIGVHVKRISLINETNIKTFIPIPKELLEIINEKN